MQYRIVEVLGAGGFGVTYLAKDETLEKLFAIKEYFPEQFAIRKGGSVRAQASKADDFQWGMQRFLEEARNLARFQHPNIVGVSQIFEANNTAYIVLEYQNGRSLKEWLKEFKDGPSQEDLDKIIAPILNALELIHRNNMLHRDLAPDNIYIREDGSPVILDFGSAREAIAARSRTISAIVKSGYSPAEQYSTRGSGQGPWSDIYALAATLYLCVTGNAPEEATERLISDQYVSAVDATKGQYRKTFLEAINWGLRLIPKDRPQTTDEWRKSLLGDGQTSLPSIEAQPASKSNALRATKHKQSKPRWFSQKKPGMALALLIVAGTVGVGAYQSREKLLSIFAPQKANVETVNSPSNSQAVNPIIRSLPTDELCRKILDNDQWSTGAAEAARRNITIESCKEITARVENQIATIRVMPLKKLCETALNGEVSDWDQSGSYKHHVDEAKRRSLSVQDCRRIVIVDAPPRTLDPPPSARPEQPRPSGKIMLGMDRVIDKEFNWTIGFNQSLAGCIASVAFGDQTTMWFGYTGPTDAVYIAFSNPNWVSVQVGGFYQLTLNFGNAGKVSAPFAGVQGLNEKGIFHSGVEKSFVDYINKVAEIGLYLDGRYMTQLSLAHFSDARAKIEGCQIAYRRAR